LVLSDQRRAPLLPEYATTRNPALPLTRVGTRTVFAAVIIGDP
jgi:hypothetical protein